MRHRLPSTDRMQYRVKALRRAWGASVVVGAVVFGYIALNTVPIAVGLLATLPLFWVLAPGRGSAGLAAGGFVAAAGWSVAPAVPNYFEDGSLHLGIAAVGLVGAVHATVWALAWTRGAGRALTGVFVIGLFAVPPLMWLGWASPLHAVGVYFPGMQWVGIGLFLASLMVLMGSRIAAGLGIAALAGTLAVLGPGMPGADRIQPANPQWHGIDTHLGELDMTNAREVIQRQHAIDRVIEAQSEDVDHVLLAEGLVGYWDFAEPMWSGFESKGSVVLVGAELEAERGRRNSLVALHDPAEFRYDQRVPIPWAGWNPLNDDSIRSDLTGPGFVDYAGQRIGVLICYEQLIAFPILVTFMGAPDVVLAPANAWWAPNEDIPEMQRNTMRSWARLFSTPVVMSINYATGKTKEGERDG